MKRTITIFFAVTTLILLLTFPSCKEDEPTAEEVFLGKVEGSWAATSVDVDGVFVNGTFENFQLNITKQKTFTTVNGHDPIWPATGSFTLEESSGGAGFKLIRSDGIEVEVSTLDETVAVLKFHYTSTGGRSASVTGNYTFELAR